MFAALRTTTPLLLLLASLTGPVASGILGLHLAIDHVVLTDHGDHDGERHGHGEDGEHDADHDPGDGHVIVAASPVFARISGAEFTPCSLVPVRQEVLDRLDGRALLLLAVPLRQSESALPRRHSILLI